MARSRSSRQVQNTTWLDAAHRVLTLAIQVANDVLPFDAHRVFITTHEEEEVWHYTTGFIRGDNRESQLDRSYELFKKLHGEKQHSIQIGERHVLLQAITFRTLRASGYLSVSRPIRQDDFSDAEKYQFECVGSLVEQAMEQEDAAAILTRLLLEMLDARLLIGQMPFDDIIEEYLTKTYRLFTGKSENDISKDFPSRKSLAIRLSFKQANDNQTALRITHCRSTKPAEWTRKRQATPYPLPEGSEQGESFAARAYAEKRAQWTNTYPDDVPDIYRVFRDTKKHVSAPVVAGSTEPLGVLSIENNGSVAYRQYHADSLTLLAAHAYRPLKNAWDRETAVRKADFFNDEVVELWWETSDVRLLEAFSKRLQNLGYARGLFSAVDYENQTIKGRWAWGADFEKVLEETDRHFVRDHKDCQVLAVISGKPVLVSDPEIDERAAEDAKAVGHLRPFGIYLIKNHRGRVIWTVHLERHDTARHNKTDEELIDKLGMRFMRAWEEEQITQFERMWFKEMMRDSAYNVNDLLCRFADCIVGHGHRGTMQSVRGE